MRFNNVSDALLRIEIGLLFLSATFFPSMTTSPGTSSDKSLTFKPARRNPED